MANLRGDRLESNRSLVWLTTDEDGTTVVPHQLLVEGDADLDGGLSLAGDATLADGSDIVLGTSTGTKFGTSATEKLAFFGAAPVARQTELTDELTTITHAAAETPDYAIQALAEGGYGFATADEGHTVLAVIANLQARVNELETKLVNLGLLADAD